MSKQFMSEPKHILTVNKGACSLKSRLYLATVSDKNYTINFYTLPGSDSFSGTKRGLPIQEDILSSLNLYLDQGQPSSPPKKQKSDGKGMI